MKRIAAILGHLNLQPILEIQDEVNLSATTRDVHLRLPDPSRHTYRTCWIRRVDGGRKKIYLYQGSTVLIDLKAWEAIRLRSNGHCWVPQ